jgi:hypothetical protein
MLQTALDALTQLGLATGAARSAPAYAIVSASHVLGIALLVGPILLVDLRLLGLLRTLDAPSVVVLRGAARIGLLLAAGTGILLLSAKPGDYAANPVVWAKLLVVTAGAVNALAFEWRARRAGVAALLEHGGRTFALLSLTLWLAALLLGRWIAFV